MSISFDEAVRGSKRDIKVECEDECDEIEIIDESQESITICCEFSSMNDVLMTCNAICDINTNVELFKYKDKYHMVVNIDTDIANKLCLRLSDFCTVNTNMLKVTLIREHGKSMGTHNIKQLAELA